MFRRLRTQFIFIMFVTGLTPMLLMGFFSLYTDYYGIPDKLKEGLMAIPFVGSFVNKGEVYFHFATYVLLALVSGIAVGIFSVLMARSITSPVKKARRMIEMMYKGELTPAFRQKQVFNPDEIGLLLRVIINTMEAMKLKQDETEKKLLFLQETDRFKTEFITNITCELRTPLTLILGPANLLLEAAPPSMSEQEVSFLKMIRDNALELKEVVHKLVAFSSGEAGGGQPSVPLKEKIEAESVILSGSEESRYNSPSLPVETEPLELHEGKEVDGKCQILIIEDNADMRRYLYSVLKENFEPIFATNEYEAMERIKERSVKLVIIDVTLADINCYAFCRKVKEELSPRFIPVVILTDRGGAVMRIMGLEAGADCYMTKPFEERELLARLKTLSAQKELFDSIHERNTQLHRAEKLRSEFVATMSHELRTPLSSISLASELLLDGISGKLNEEQKKQLGIIHLSCQNLLRLINNVLSLSKINAGKMDINPAEVDLKKLIDNVLKEISPLANEKGLHLQSRLCKIPVIISDGDKIRQVLLNIISNAIKFTPFGGGVEISARVSEELKVVEISVADTGVGIPHDALDTIFEEYKQIKVDKNRSVEGVGLGLSITKKLVTLLGGEIWVKSKLGEGSVFSFTLPQGGGIIGVGSFN